MLVGFVRKGEFKMEGYSIGQKPPGLAEDGSFDVGFGVRGFSITDDEGRILSVDKSTGLLVEDGHDD